MTKALRARLRAIILALTFAASMGVASAQNVPLISVPFSMTGAGSGPVISLGGQSSCSIALSNAGSGLTLIPQVSSDNGATWVTATTIGGGSIGAIGSYVGNVGGLGLTTFRFIVSALSSGTVSGQETCSSALGLADSGGLIGAVNVTQINGASVGSPTAAGVSATGNILGIQGVTGGLAVPISGAITGSGNFTVVQPTGTNLHAVLDTTSTTAVTQPTGTNLHAVLDTTSTTAVTQATGTNLHAVLDTTSTTAVTQATATNLNATVVGAGVAGTPAGGVVSVQGVAGGTAQPVTGTFFQATQPVSCASGATCPVNATLQTGANTIGNVNQTTGTSGYSFLLDAAGTNKASINLPGAQLVAQGKTRFILTSGSATACTNLQATAGTLVTIINAGSATAVFPAWYDDAGATCATGARLYGNFTSLTLQAGQVVNLNAPLTAGLAYKLSGALSDNLVVVTN